MVSKTIDAPYAPGNRGLWRKAKALNRQEFVIVGWSDPEGSRPHLGALLLGYYTDDGKLIYAGRVGTGMPDKVLADLRRRLDPLARKTSPLSVLPPRKTRFGSPLVLSRVHWVEPKLVAEITYLTWTADNLLRHTVYVGLREDKPARAGAAGNCAQKYHRITLSQSLVSSSPLDKNHHAAQHVAHQADNVVLGCGPVCRVEPGNSHLALTILVTDKTRVERGCGEHSHGIGDAKIRSLPENIPLVIVDMRLVFRPLVEKWQYCQLWVPRHSKVMRMTRL